jgi:hypothetical protein
MVRIGATGHRFLTDLEKVSAGVETALEQIEELSPRSAFTAVSSLAEGADCLIAKHVLSRSGARLIVPLPLPAADYLQDFVSEEAANTFCELLMRADEVIELPATTSRDKSYEAAADFVVRNCDVLLAIWDGRSAQGHVGTGHAVQLARSLRLPLAWVHAGNREPGTNEPTSFGEEQGRVEFERFDALIERRA